MKLCQISSCILILLATIYVTSSQYFCNFSQNFLGDLQLTLPQVWNVSLNQTVSAKGLCVVMVLGTRRIKTYAIIRVCMHLFVPKLNLRNGINSSVTKKKNGSIGRRITKQHSHVSYWIFWTKASIWVCTSLRICSSVARGFFLTNSAMASRASFLYASISSSLVSFFHSCWRSLAPTTVL